MSDKKMIDEDAASLELGDNYHRTLASELQQWLDKELAKIPADLRPSAFVSVWKWEHDDGRIELGFSRPESDIERDRRVAAEKAYADDRSKRERDEFMRLKAKFEGATKA